MNQQRVRTLKGGAVRRGPVVYWMSRDQRSRDNWALFYAQRTALELKSPLIVVFCLAPQFLGATLRQYAFMLAGLRELQQELKEKNIGLHLVAGEPQEEIPRFLEKSRAGLLVTDFDPLRIKREWKKEVAASCRVPFHEVDAHNIVPCWVASPKQEFGAYTLRPKIHRLLDEFLTDFPTLKRHPYPHRAQARPFDTRKVCRGLAINTSVAEVEWLASGEKAGSRLLRKFIAGKLDDYPEKRNDPACDGQSNLSPYLHFGQLSAQRVALLVLRSKATPLARESFLEELIVRRELSDNFCFYNQDYDNFKGVPAWARKTLTEHRRDRRDYLYSLEQFEQAATHDDLWNAAQKQMVDTGKMHGYMRMYWAKKILEWTRSVDEAFEFAVYLNDTYELDGRDPNGYAGISWSIGGTHDRAWGERPVFGKVRYMSHAGCKRRVDVVCNSLTKRGLQNNYYAGI